MQKNTFILVVVLAIIASLLVGFNVGRKLHPNSSNSFKPSVTSAPTPTTIPTSSYTNTYCRVGLTYPSTMQVTELATGSAKFTSASDVVVLACQKDIPQIAVEDNQKETITVGSVSGTLYHTATPKDGTPIDVAIFHHPKTDMDILVSGIGDTFTAIRTSVVFLP